MRLIDLNKIPHKAFRGDRDDLVDALVSAPTVDAVPVCRCKDCKWFGLAGCAIQIVDDTDKPSEDDFCSFAEQKEAAQ